MTDTMTDQQRIARIEQEKLETKIKEEKYRNQQEAIPQATQEILRETSEQIKKQRDETFVAWQEIENILQNQDGLTLYKELGLSSSNFYENKRNNKARLVTKYALLGLLAEKTQSTYQFSHQELALIFTSLLFFQTSATPEILEQINKLQTVLAKLMSHQS